MNGNLKVVQNFIGLYVNNKLAGYCIGVFRAAKFIARNKVFLIIQILRNPAILLMVILKVFFTLLNYLFYYKKNILIIMKENQKYFGILAIVVDPEYQNNGF